MGRYVQVSHEAHEATRCSTWASRGIVKKTINIILMIVIGC